MMIKPPSAETASNEDIASSSTASQNAAFVPLIFEPMQRREIYDISSTDDDYDNALDCCEYRRLSSPHVC